jgi:hypothetical protein
MCKLGKFGSKTQDAHPRPKGEGRFGMLKSKRLAN